jgi:RNA polymerase sigma factor (sigma-70 family)
MQIGSPLWTNLSRISAKGDTMKRQASDVLMSKFPTKDLPEKYSSTPPTQEFMAEFIGAKRAGKKLSHPQEHTFEDSLYNSIYPFVFKMCARYAKLFGSELEDVAQDCMIAIFNRIGKFDSSRAHFSTWSGWICLSIVDSKRRRKMRENTRLIFNSSLRSFTDASCMPNFMADTSDAGIEVEDRGRSGGGKEEIAEDDWRVIGPSHTRNPVAVDIAQAVSDLAKEYPKKRKLIFEMFGNPKKNDLYFPVKVSVAQAARDAKEEASEAYYFYSRIVRPFFQRRFQ